MALPDTRKGSQVALYLGSDADTPVFAFVCGIETTEISLERGVIERPMRDCTTPFADPTMQRKPGMKTASVSGSGLLAAEYIDELQGAYDAAAARSWRIQVEDGPTWEGEFILSSFSVSANADGQSYSEVSLTLQSNGAVSYTPAV